MSTDEVKYFEDFGSLLSFVLDLKGLGTSDIAKIVEKDVSQVSNWVHNRYKPYRKTYKYIATKLEIDISETDNKWKLTLPLTPSTPSKPTLTEETELTRQLQSKFAEYEAQLIAGNTSDADLDLIVSYALKEAESLADSLKRLQVALKNRLNKLNHT